MFCYRSDLVLHFDQDYERMNAQVLLRFSDGISLASIKLDVPMSHHFIPAIVMTALHVTAARGWVNICVLLTNQHPIMPECVDSCGNILCCSDRSSANNEIFNM